MSRLLKRILLISCLAAAVSAAAFVGEASANYFGVVSITCTEATYNLSTFPAGSQDVLETFFIDGNVARTQLFSFVGPTSGSSTLSFSVPSDGQTHTIEANAYSLTN